MPLARNLRVGGAATAKVFLSPGREDDLDLNTPRRPARRIGHNAEGDDELDPDTLGRPARSTVTSSGPPPHRPRSAAPRARLDLFVGREREPGQPGQPGQPSQPGQPGQPGEARPSQARPSPTNPAPLQPPRAA